MEPGEREVQAAVADRGQQRLARVLGQHQLDPGMRVVERRHGRGEGRRTRGRGADRDPPVAQSLDGVDRGAHAGDGRERGPRVGEHRGAGGGRRHPSAAPVKERLTELGLEADDLCADPRLRDVLPPRRGGEAALVDDRHEVGELPEFHNRSC